MCNETPQPAILFFTLRLAHLCLCELRATERNEIVWPGDSSSWRGIQADLCCFLNFSCFSLHFLSFFHSVCFGRTVHNANMRNPDNYYVPRSYSMAKRYQHVQRAQTLCPFRTNLWSLAICWKENDCFVFAVTFAASPASSVPSPTFLSVGKTYINNPLWKISHCLDSNRTFARVFCLQLSHNEQSKSEEWKRERDCNRIFI